MSEVLQFKLVREGARLPQRATPSSGAFDLFAPCDGYIEPKSRLNVPIGIAHQIDERNCQHSEIEEDFRLQGLMIPRSGLATKYGIRLFYEGLIDHDYRGEIHVCLENTSDESFSWKAGERLCQIAYIPCFVGPCEQIYVLDETQRGTGGFGSTGR